MRYDDVTAVIPLRQPSEIDDPLTAVLEIGVPEVTYYRWRAEHGGLKLDQVRRLKVLDQENGRLRRAVHEARVQQNRRAPQRVH